MRELTNNDLLRATGGLGLRRKAAAPAPAPAQRKTLSPEEAFAQMDSQAEKAFGSM